MALFEIVEKEDFEKYPLRLKETGYDKDHNLLTLLFTRHRDSSVLYGIVIDLDYMITVYIASSCVEIGIPVHSLDEFYSILDEWKSREAKKRNRESNN